MVMPSAFGKSLIDEFEKDFFRSENRTSSFKGLMRTDVRENNNSYELDIDLPDFKNILK